MILYKNVKPEDKRDRKNRTINIEIGERPERSQFVFRSNNDRIKFIKGTEKLIRSSMEYKDYIKFLKDHMDMNRCIILKNIVNGNGKHYSIEIHHEPFTLFDLVDISLCKADLEGMPRNQLKIAEEVMELHYAGLIGLVPLTKTQHELVTNGKVFIPLSKIYQDYAKYYKEYKEYLPDAIREKLDYKIRLSMASDNVQSDVLDTEFIYINCDGFDFPYPKVPEEWGKALQAETPEESEAVGENE
jgi:hypothetical protein